MFDDLYLGDAVFNNVCLSGTSIRMSSLKDMSIADCCIDGLTGNGVDIAALLDRQGASEESQL